MAGRPLGRRPTGLGASTLRHFGVDELGQHPLEPLEVGVELTTGVVFESSGHLADRKAEDGGADETLRLGNSFLIDPRLSQRQIDAVAPYFPNLPRAARVVAGR